MKLKQIFNLPFFLSLIFSHGSGFYALKMPKQAKRYLWASIIFTDLPIVMVIIGIISNKMNPDFYQGAVLTITEYVFNIILISLWGSIPVIRCFECWNITKIKK
ncbi:MAG: hypothetical protein WC752_00355 [Patescibacteria group bacterium]|jgi:hypothetical protein